MKRIAVIGAGGAGKTRLARALGAALDLPAERWVMDGNDANTLSIRLERADTVVFRRRRRPFLLRTLASWDQPIDIRTLRSRREVREFLSSLDA